MAPNPHDPPQPELAGWEPISFQQEGDPWVLTARLRAGDGWLYMILTIWKNGVRRLHGPTYVPQRGRGDD